MTLTVGSLCSGIGGLDLGLERAGMEVVWNSEVDPFCRRLLHRRWPHVPNLGDLTLINWAEVPPVDLICGGYPCQPFSVAGRRLGEQDPRHLWPDVCGAVRALRPNWVLLENVAGHLALGFGRVLGDLAEIGYDAEWDCIPAAAVGAPHRRDRVFIVAYPQRDEGRPQPLPVGRGGGAPVAGLDGQDGHVADPYELTGRSLVAPEYGNRAGTLGRRTSQPGRRRGLLAGPRVLGRGHRPGGEWTAEPDVGRVAHGVPARLDRLRGLGNAVVPQVAEHVGRLIVEAAA